MRKFLVALCITACAVSAHAAGGTILYTIPVNVTEYTNTADLTGTESSATVNIMGLLGMTPLTYLNNEGIITENRILSGQNLNVNDVSASLIGILPGSCSASENSGTIELNNIMSDVTLGSSLSNYSSSLYGYIFSNGVNNFSNTGTISLNTDYSGITYTGYSSLTNGIMSAGIMNSTGTAESIVNDGTISINGSVSDSDMGTMAIGFTTFGLYSVNTSADLIENSGTISISNSISNVTTSSTLSFANTTALYATGSTSLDRVSNSGDILIDLTIDSSDSMFSSMTANGINVSSVSANNVSNSGTINISTNYTGNTSTMLSSGTSGIYSNNGHISSLTNSGDILLSYNFSDNNDATGYGVIGAAGISLLSADTTVNSGDIHIVNTFSNNNGGSIALQDLFGIRTTSSGSVLNSGDITIQTTLTDNNISGADSVLGLAGIFTYADSTVNTGTITNIYTDTGGTAALTPLYMLSGVTVFTPGAAAVSNSGDITVDITSDKTGSITFSADIALLSSTAGTLTNSGDLTLNVDAPNATTTGTAAILIAGSSSTVKNTGNVFMTTTNPDAAIYSLGIYAAGSATFNDQFNAAAGVCSGCEDMGMIHIDAGSSLDINDAKLGITLNKYFRFNTPYTVIDNEGSVTGSFSALAQYTNSDFRISWYDAERGEDAKVIATYSPTVSAAGKSVMAGINSAKSAGKIFSGSMFSGGAGSFGGFSSLGSNSLMLADSGEIATDAGLSYAPKNRATSIYAFPFMSRQNGDGYDNDTFGVGVGISHIFQSGVSGSFYMGNMTSNLDFEDASMNKTQSDSFFMGASAKTDKNIYTSLSAIGFLTDNDYEGYAGANNDTTETADYNSKGFQTEALGGYNFRFAKGVKLTPFAGLSLSYYDMDGYSTDIADSAYSAFSKDYEAYTGWDTSLIAGLSVEYVMAVGTGKAKLFGEYRFENAIGDNDITIGQSIPQMNTGTIEIDQEVDNSTHTLSLGGEYSGSFWTAGAFGQYAANSDYDSYSLKLTAGLKF